MRRVRNIIAALFILCFGMDILSMSSTAQAQDKTAQVKAVFLFKFFDYVTWPSGKVPSENGNSYLCTYGGHPFGETLNYIAARKSGKYQLRTKAINSLDEGRDCHVLYVSRSNYSDIASWAKGRGVLVVGESSGVLSSGGAIRLQENDRKIGLIINLENAKRQGLKISSRLLDIAEVER